MTEPTTQPKLSEDAAIVLALAETAVSFAASAEDEAERWVRVLRLHGEVGCALQALGVPEGPLENAARSPARRGWRLRRFGQDVVELVRRRASTAAAARGSTVCGTVDVLFAVLATYGPLLDRALYIRGTSRQEVLEQLEQRHSSVATADGDPASR
jgi:hypothetical protein